MYNDKCSYKFWQIVIQWSKNNASSHVCRLLAPIIACRYSIRADDLS